MLLGSFAFGLSVANWKWWRPQSKYLGNVFVRYSMTLGF